MGENQTSAQMLLSAGELLDKVNTQETQASTTQRRTQEIKAKYKKCITAINDFIKIL